MIPLRNVRGLRRAPPPCRSYDVRPMFVSRITWQQIQEQSPEDNRLREAIGGELYVTPAPSIRHQRVSGVGMQLRGTARNSRSPGQQYVSYKQTIRMKGRRMPGKQKLTLSIDPEVVRRAKALAREWETSVSSLVEARLRSLTEPTPSGETPIVSRLRGVLPPDVDRREHRGHLEEKHSG